MKKCKYCQSDIAENAKNCPNCGQRQGKGKIIAIIIIVVLILFAISSGGSDEPKSNDGKNNSSKSSENINEKIFNVGEEIEYKNMKLIVNSVNFKSNYQYNNPDEGNEFVEINITLENVGDSEESYGTYDFSIVNSQGSKTDVDVETYTIDGGLSSGELIAGGKVTGNLVFQVPQNDEKLTLYYSPSFWSEKYVKVDCTKK